MRRLYVRLCIAAFLAAGFQSGLNANSISSDYPMYLDGPVDWGKQDPLSLETIMKSIPTPLEISLLIKEVGTLYNKADLNDSDAVSRYSTQYKKAINLGIYSTDLGYANIYGKNQDALSYLSSVRQLAADLRIEQFFDYATIKALAESSDKLDELIQTTTANFEKINFHLREQKRDYLSILLLTGGWLEALYLTTVVQQKSQNDQLKEKLGEQKIVLEQILVVLDVYKTKPGFEELISDLSELQGVYDEIEIVTESGDGEMKEVDGQLVVTGGDVTTVKITDADADTIANLVKSIRNKIIK